MRNDDPSQLYSPPGNVINALLLSKQRPMILLRYISLTLISFVILVKELYINGFPGLETSLLPFLAFLLAYPRQYVVPWASAFFIRYENMQNYVTFLGALINIAPILATIGLIWILSRPKAQAFSVS